MRIQQRSLREIAELLQGDIIHLKPGEDILIEGASSIERSKEKYITFFSDPRYLKHLSQLKASAVIVSEKLEFSIPQIVVQNPKLAFAKVLALYSHFPTLPSGFSPHAVREEQVLLGKDVSIGAFVYLGKGARIGDRTIIYPGVFVGENVSIGEDCVIYPNATLYASVTMGKRVIIHAGTVLGADGFGYVFDGKSHQKIPQVGTLAIEDDVEIGANSTIDRAAVDETKIGEGTKIDNLVQVGHNCEIGPFNILCGQAGFAGGVRTGTGVMCGGQVGVGDHAVIPDGVKIVAQSGIMPKGDMEPHETYWGTPATNIKETRKIFSIFFKLPQIYKRLKLLEKKVSLLDKK